MFSKSRFKHLTNRSCHFISQITNGFVKPTTGRVVLVNEKLSQRNWIHVQTASLKALPLIVGCQKLG